MEQKKKLNEPLEAKLKHIIKSTVNSGLLKQFLEIAELEEGIYAKIILLYN